MKKVAFLLVAAMLVLSTAAFAQADALLGPHNLANTKGCTSCHSPHNGSLDNGGVAATGKLYLWGQKFNEAVFTTYGGATTSSTLAAAVKTDVNLHTILCMSCHDNGVSGVTMDSMATLGEDLSTTHPVDVQYTGSPYDWAITITAGRASFTDTAFAGGHPARLYVNAAGTAAYVECSTCHNPHAWQNAVVKIAGVNASKPTAKFVRGWYDPTDGSTQANFCRSCHYSKTMDYVNNAGAAK